MQIRAVLFDCDGVLQRPSNDWAADLGRVTGLSGAEGEAFGEALAEADRASLTGTAPLTDLVEPILRRYGLDHFTPADVLDTFQHLVVDAAMLDGARALRRAGVECGLGTNQHPERAAYMRRTLGYDCDFDPIVISCEIGLAKPDPAYFTYAVEQLGVPAGQVLFVDDVPANVEGARSAGLVAEVFARDAGRPELDRILARHGLAERVAA